MDKLEYVIINSHNADGEYALTVYTCRVCGALVNTVYWDEHLAICSATQKASANNEMNEVACTGEPNCPRCVHDALLWGVAYTYRDNFGRAFHLNPRRVSKKPMTKNWPTQEDRDLSKLDFSG